MNWAVVAGVTVSFVGGINLGVLLMVALQAGKRQEHSYDERVLLARIEDLERALSRQPTEAGPTKIPGPMAIVGESPKVDSAGTHRVTG